MCVFMLRVWAGRGEEVREREKEGGGGGFIEKNSLKFSPTEVGKT